MSALPSACFHLPPPGPAEPAPTAPEPASSRERIDAFIAAALAGDVALAQRLCSEWQHDTAARRGRAAPAGDVYFGLVMPAIRQLDRLWHDDRLDYERVSTAFFTLQRVLRGALQAPPAGGTPQPGRGRVCLTLLPGAQHDFGVCIVADALQQAGWQVQLFGGDQGAELLRTLQQQPVALLGLSVGNDRELEAAAALVAQARVRSCHAGLRILIGGNILTEPRAQYAFIQADGVAFSAAEAVAYAEAVGGISPSGPLEAP